MIPCLIESATVDNVQTEVTGRQVGEQVIVTIVERHLSSTGNVKAAASSSATVRGRLHANEDGKTWRLEPIPAQRWR